MTRDARRTKLKRTWYFDCGCTNCEDLATEESKHSAKCCDPNCGGNVSVDITNWIWSPCSICGSQLTKEYKFRYQETYQMVREVVDENGGEYTYTDVNEFLVRHMSSLFHPQDIELLQAANGAANGYYISKDWVKAIPFFELSLPGIRKYYTSYCGYLGSALERYADCLYHSKRYEQAKQVIEEAHEIMKVIPGIQNYYYDKYFLPKYFEIKNLSIK